MQEHQREEPLYLRFVGHQLGQRPAQVDRLVGQLTVAAVALVEDQIHDRQHCGQAVGQEVRGWNPERHAGRLDLPLGAHEPLRHRRLRDEERTRDPVGRETSERPQRQRDLRVERQCGMAAGEDELEPLVGDGCVVHGVLHGFGYVQQPGLGGERAVAADPVDRPVPGGRQKPRAGVLGRTCSWPPLGGGRERLLRGFLGEVEVAEEADQRGDDAPPLVAERPARG